MAEFVASKIERWLLQKSVVGSYGGILLVNLSSHEERSRAFPAFCTAALQLIETHDPRRFRRIQHEVRHIVNKTLLSGGSYRRALRRCDIDFSRYYVAADDLNYDWYVAWFASTLVHEATHGRIFSFGIPYDEKNWQQIERLCRTEQRRFVSRLHDERWDFSTLVPAFDAAEWLPFRNMTRWQEARALIKRVWQQERNGRS